MGSRNRQGPRLQVDLSTREASHEIHLEHDRPAPGLEGAARLSGLFSPLQLREGLEPREGVEDSVARADSGKLRLFPAAQGRSSQASRGVSGAVFRRIAACA